MESKHSVSTKNKGLKLKKRENKSQKTNRRYPKADPSYSRRQEILDKLHHQSPNNDHSRAHEYNEKNLKNDQSTKENNNLSMINKSSEQFVVPAPVIFTDDVEELNISLDNVKLNYGNEDSKSSINDEELILENENKKKRKKYKTKHSQVNIKFLSKINTNDENRDTQVYKLEFHDIEYNGNIYSYEKLCNGWAYYYCVNNRKNNHLKGRRKDNCKSSLRIEESNIINKIEKAEIIKSEHSCIKKLAEVIEPSFINKMELSSASIKNANSSGRAYHRFLDELEILLLKENITLQNFMDRAYEKFVKKDFMELDLKEIEFEMPDNIALKNTFYKFEKLKEKFSINYPLTHRQTISGNSFLRLYYDKDCLFNNEKSEIKFFIWNSNYQLTRLRMAPHFYIDGNRRAPAGFYQTLIISIEDLFTQRLAPCAFILVDKNLDTNSYYTVFSEFLNILKENSSEIKLNLESITCDFEEALRCALAKVFPNCKQVGCYFHVVQALWRHAAKLGLKKEENVETTKELIEKLSQLCYVEQTELNSAFLNLKSTYTNENFHEFFKYFEKEWIPELKKGTINYTELDKSRRSNSCLENFNKRMKSGCGKETTWDKYLNFLRNEESHFKIETRKMEDQGKIHVPFMQNKKYFKLTDEKKINLKRTSDDPLSEDDLLLKKNKKPIIKKKGKKIESTYTKTQSSKKIEIPQNLIEKKTEKGLVWMKNKNNSCRYDSFLTIFLLNIFNKKNIEYWNKLKLENLNCIDFVELISTCEKLNQKYFDVVFEYWRFRDDNFLDRGDRG
jgi:hypothetical protein